MRIAYVVAIAILVGGLSQNIAFAMDKSTPPVTIIMLGDSLTAGYGLEQKHSLPTQLQKSLRENGHDVTIINAGVSGDTTAGGLERLAWTLAEPAEYLAIALGANDGLRGVNPALTRDNLDKMIAQAQEIDPDMQIVLLGMLAPPNLGKDYAAQFNSIYPDLAEKYDIPLYPFLLEGVVAKRSLNQNDGIHPNPKGVQVLVKRLTPFFADILAPLD